MNQPFSTSEKTTPVQPQLSAKSHASFTLTRQEYIPSLQLHGQLYTHTQTGAVHLHLASEQKENVFLVAFRTMPMDSTGVAHILEHTALCGSKKYPIRDPFFMMIRRSLNTYMNALTSSDWTAYPFASQNKKDYFNLLDVYLDATFFSRLDPLDFAQEGHRLELETQDEQEVLVRKGVVYNEMKGAMSSPISQLWQNVCQHLFPTTTYHFNSGGEPSQIPELTYAQLLAFYRRHYHPSNAIIFTCGDIPAAEIQEKVDRLALSQFEKTTAQTITVRDEQRYYSPFRVQESYAFSEQDDSNKSHHVMAWLLGSSVDLYEQMKASLLERVLLDNSASPLRQVLETCGIGNAPSPLCGLENSNREMAFLCAIEGAEPEQGKDFEALVIDCLQSIVNDGIEQHHIEAALHQLELSQREIGGDGYPFGLQLAFTAIPSLIHHGDALATLNLDPAIERLREDVKQPNFIKQLVQDLLLNNPHRLTYSMAPDKQMSEQRQAHHDKQLAELYRNMSDDDKATLRAQTQAFNERQSQEDDIDILPKVTRDDIPVDYEVPKPSDYLHPQMHYYAAGTNGLVYHQILLPWPKLNQEEMRYLPLFAYLCTEVGINQADYLSVQGRQASECGEIHAYLSKRGKIDDANVVDGYFVLSSKGLVHKHQQITDLLMDTLKDCRFDEPARIRDLIAQLRARREHSLADGGTRYAMTCASQTVSTMGNINFQQSGLENVRWIQALDDSLADDAVLQDFCQRLTAIQQQLWNSPKQTLTVAETEQQSHVLSSLQTAMGTQLVSTESGMQAKIVWPYENKTIRQVWSVNTQVNYCARCYATVPSAHQDAPALVILGEVLSNGFLHRSIREQGGAYGGGAGQDNNGAAFRFYSYRDPRSTETFADFDKAIVWACEGKFTQEHLEEAVLKIISNLDKPGSPAGEAMAAFHNRLYGRTAEVLRDLRQRILQVTPADVSCVAHTYLQEKDHHDAIVGPASLKDEEYFKDFDKHQI